MDSKRKWSYYMEKKCKHLSTPIWVYIIITIVILVLLCATYLPHRELSGLTSNVSFSLIASLLTALLTDYGMTKLQRIRWKQQKEILTGTLKKHCLHLLEAVPTAAEMRGEKYENEEKSFAGWAEIALNPYRGNLEEDIFWDAIFEVIFRIGKIGESANKLIEYSLFFLENGNITLEFRRELKKLASICFLLERYFDHERYDMLLVPVSKKLPTIITDLFPELKTDFEKKYMHPEFED